MHRRCARYLLVLGMVALSFMAIRTEAKKPETGFLDRTLAVGGTTYKYQVFIPDDWTKQKKWPVILFLHGAGERGEDGLVPTEVGIGTAIRRDRSRFPAIVVMPQCRKNGWWSEPTMANMAMAALGAAQKEFRGDTTRIYLTGLSLGGYGTWYLAGKYPGKFAAIAPICGGILVPDMARQQSPDDNSPYAEAAKKIGKTPVWIFHGGDDPVVPVSESRRMNEAMKGLGGEVHYTEYPGLGHNSWEKAYAEADFISWMFSKTTTANAGK